MRIINKIGNEELLNREKTLFLCSKHAPYSVYDKVFGWVDSLTADDCVICFNSSELEDEVMRALLVNQVPTILVVMNRFTDKYNIQIEKALTEERMLILVLQRDEPYGAGQTPRPVTSHPKYASHGRLWREHCSGFPKIIAAWKETGWGEPELKNKIEVDEVELVLPVSAATTNVVKDVVKDVVKELTDRQQVILELLALDPTMSAKAISEKISEKTSEKTSEKFTVTDRTIESDLAHLKKIGILVREGGRKDGKWVIVIENKEAT